MATARGWHPPEKVQAATQAYRKEQDTIGQFISERCDTGEDYMQCKASALYKAYRQWAEANDSSDLQPETLWDLSDGPWLPLDGNTTGRGAFRLKIALQAIPEDEDEAEAD